MRCQKVPMSSRKRASAPEKPSYPSDPSDDDDWESTETARNHTEDSDDDYEEDADATMDDPEPAGTRAPTAPKKPKAVTKKQLLEAPKQFVDTVALSNRGDAVLRVMSKPNMREQGEYNRSLLRVYENFFQLHPDSDHILGMATALDTKKHHEGKCFKPDRESETPGCGCMTNGKRFIKHLGFQKDARHLEPLFKEGSICFPVLHTSLKDTSASDLARKLAVDLGALERECTPVPSAPAAKKPKASEPAAGQKAAASSSSEPRPAAVKPAPPDYAARLAKVRAGDASPSLPAPRHAAARTDRRHVSLRSPSR